MRSYCGTRSRRRVGPVGGSSTRPSPPYPSTSAPSCYGPDAITTATAITADSGRSCSCCAPVARQSRRARSATKAMDVARPAAGWASRAISAPATTLDDYDFATNVDVDCR